MNNKITRKMYPLYMLIPAVLVFTAFYVFSIVSGFSYSLTNWNMRFDEFKFVGFQNFIMLFEEKQFLAAVINNFIFSFTSMLFKVAFGLMLAIILNRQFKGKNWYRAIFYFPCILSPLVLGYIFKFIYQPTDGLLDKCFAALGLTSLSNTAWLGGNLALYAVIFVEIWMWSGWDATIFLAGLKTIPKELEEASYIDGANSFQTFRYIKWPLLRSSLTIIVTTNLIGGFKVFDLVVAMTNGGPIYLTETMSTFLYKIQSRGTLGYASAMGIVQFLIITAVCVPILLILRRKEVKE